MNAPYALRINGVPFVFDRFRLDARIRRPIADQPPGGPAVMEPGFPAADQSYRMPIEFDVLAYAPR
jgi:hypothetical protein